MAPTRRDFLKTTAASALLAGVPAGWRGAVYASDAPETPKVRIGIIALTDCSSIVMAHELGLLKKHGIESTISKEASWAVIRDRLTLGENQATHLLLGIPYAATMGLQGSPVKPMVIPMYLNRNGQAITLTKALLDKGVKTPQQLKPLAFEAKAKGSPMTFAMTYPPGTHAMWTRYWLAAGGINPDRDISLITIPPAQMVANMKVGKMDGYCVGEPWGARAIADGIGFTAVTTQQIWKDHPEKVLGFTEEFATKNPKTVKAVMRAVLEASQWNDKLENRAKMAEVVGQPQYVNAAKDIILGRMLGDYDYGDG
ncbi:MAG: nitrate ABC transporter substrate-binding protein, partial [Candidatus Rokuibacteriota bacterium]